MSKITYLSESVINQIAAGEVVEHPASVIKELIENAIDAKSSKITIFIKQGGFEEIVVEDNGEGMDKEDVKLSIKRHATSKIQKTEDLFTLKTMGFRGEALASIASIAKIRIKSSQGKMGFSLLAHAGNIQEEKEDLKLKGTSISVSSLFYNVPARLAFQKSVAASTAEITRYITALALSQEEVEFTLYAEKEKKLFVPSLSHRNLKESLQNRLEMLGKKELFEGGKWVDFTKDFFSLRGWFSSSELVKKNRLNQFLFINRRWVFSPQISSMIKEMYSTSIGEKGFPCFLLFLQIPEREVDVNVHPQKKEVRIQNLSSVRKFLWEAFFSLHPSFKIEKGAFFAEEIPFLPKLQTYEESREEKELFLFSEVFFFHMQGKFLLGVQQEKKNLILINVSLLHEALFGRWLAKPKELSQGLIKPILVDLSKEEIDKIDLFSDAWKEKGIELRKISEKTVAVDRVPSFVSFHNVPFFLQEMLAFSEKKPKGKGKYTFSFEEAKALYSLAEKERVDKTLFQTDVTEEKLSKL